MTSRPEKIRYAVVGLGHIAQSAVLPAFQHSKNSVLTALVSSDDEKLRKLSKKYKIKHTYTYEQYDLLLKSGEIDAVYIALPNSMHHDFAVRAAEAGIHVLCEKPMALNSEDCEKMIRAAEKNDVKLMIAYRLHFEKANLKAIELAQKGKLGELKLFQSVFSFPVKPGNIREKASLGGGPLYDIGIYCINASRYLFRDEPNEVFAWSIRKNPRSVDETVSAIMRFPGDRLATFTCSFGVSPVAHYQLIGTRGNLKVENAYEYSEKIKHLLTIKNKTSEKIFDRRDQFGPELVYFSRCILTRTQPEPSGVEGLADIRIIEALQKSLLMGRPEKVITPEVAIRPEINQEINLPPVKSAELVNAEEPFKDAA